jgi:cation diffusion facilitator CzcD-associated flavoprotein CzcO
VTVGRSSTDPRVCVIGAGPCGLTAVKNLLQAGCRDVVCYEEGAGIGGNWAFTDDPGRVSVHESTHTISSRRMSAFEDFPMPRDYPDFPSHRQMLRYFADYVQAFRLAPHIRLGSRVERCTLDDDGGWTVRVRAGGATRTEAFDAVLVCSGHHRDVYVPRYPGAFAGPILHSSAYKRPDPFRGQRVLVVGAGNSAADIAVDLGRVAARTALSMRAGSYVVPKLVFGQPVDVVYTFWRNKLPPPLFRSALKLWLRHAIGRWAEYGLPPPTHAPLEKPPIVNSGVLAALHDGRLVARRGVERYDGSTVHFTDGTREDFDAIIMGTGFRISFPFLSPAVVSGEVTGTPPLYLRMMHPTIPKLFFIGLFQPIGCIWRLADHQARVAALQLTGRLDRPTDLAARIRRDRTHPRHAIAVDYHAFRRDLRRELAAARPGPLPVGRRYPRRDLGGGYSLRSVSSFRRTGM